MKEMPKINRQLSFSAYKILFLALYLSFIKLHTNVQSNKFEYYPHFRVKINLKILFILKRIL